LVRHTELPISIVRDTPAIPLFPFTDYFKGFERVRAVQEVFGDETEDVLENLKVAFVSNRYMYMGVRDQDGNLTVGTHHLKNSDLRTLYLDVIHELFHVKQYMNGKRYFRREHQRYLKNGFDTALYFKSPIEVPAYKHAVDEAKRTGMTFDEISEYLKMGPVDSDVFSELLHDVGLDRGMKPASPKKLRVKINRKALIQLHPFTDYFKGLENIKVVRDLLGPRTNDILAGLEVEFSPSRIRMITVDETDGHLQVSSSYLKAADKRLLYFDILACLSTLKSRSVSDSREPANGYMVAESYRMAVSETKRLGLSNATLIDHLSAMRFMLGPEELERFMRKAGLDLPRPR
jgi:hypothetical protein